MKKLIIISVSLLLLCFLLIWFIPFIQCEFLTVHHGREFVDLQKGTHMINDVECLKVLTYSEDFARVYYVGDTGDILSFRKVNETWELEHNGWETVWSKTGSADGFVWPYFYHSPEGIVVFLLLIFVLIAVIVIGTGLLYS